MKYQIQVYNPETDTFDMVATTDYTVRIVSTQYNEKVVFETDDPEFNG